MTSTSQTQFAIDPQEVRDLAAQKVADAVLAEYPDLYDTVSSRIEAELASVITSEFRDSMVATVDQKLAEETEKALQQRIVPVDIWGEGKGEPTTIREQLHKRALEYWEERVEPDRNNPGRYRPTSYGGAPRHKLVFQDVAKTAFEEAIKANVTEMVKAFRDAMRKDASKVISEHIEKIINNRVLDRK